MNCGQTRSDQHVVQGEHPHRVWNQIYSHSCFQGMTNASECTEQRVFYKLISGMQIISAPHLVSDLPSPQGLPESASLVWLPNSPTGLLCKHCVAALNRVSILQLHKIRDCVVLWLPFDLSSSLPGQKPVPGLPAPQAVMLVPTPLYTHSDTNEKAGNVASLPLHHMLQTMNNQRPTASELRFWMQDDLQAGELGGQLANW